MLSDLPVRQTLSHQENDLQFAPAQATPAPGAAAGSPSTPRRNATTGAIRPLTNLGSIRDAGNAEESAMYVAWLTMVSPGAASACNRSARLAVSPTTVYSSRPPDPSRAVATSPVQMPIPAHESWQPERLPTGVQSGLCRVQRPGRVHRAVGVAAADVAAEKTPPSPKSPVNCMTMPIAMNRITDRVRDAGSAG